VKKVLFPVVCVALLASACGGTSSSLPDVVEKPDPSYFTNDNQTTTTNDPNSIESDSTFKGSLVLPEGNPCDAIKDETLIQYGRVDEGTNVTIVRYGPPVESFDKAAIYYGESLVSGEVVGFCNVKLELTGTEDDTLYVTISVVRGGEPTRVNDPDGSIAWKEATVAGGRRAFLSWTEFSGNRLPYGGGVQVGDTWFTIFIFGTDFPISKSKYSESEYPSKQEIFAVQGQILDEVFDKMTAVLTDLAAYGNQVAASQ
jgi:hypothetical protein